MSVFLRFRCIFVIATRLGNVEKWQCLNGKKEMEESPRGERGTTCQRVRNGRMLVGGGMKIDQNVSVNTMGGWKTHGRE